MTQEQERAEAAARIREANSLIPGSIWAGIVREMSGRPTDPIASDAPGSWKCGRCGFRGFWYGGPHC